MLVAAQSYSRKLRTEIISDHRGPGSLPSQLSEVHHPISMADDL